MAYFKANKLRFSTICSTVLCTLAIGVSSASMASEKKILFAHAMSSEHIFNPIADRFMSDLEENMPGHFKVKYHPGGDLGDWSSQFEQTVSGEIDATLSFQATDFDPRLNISIMGLVAKNWEDAKKIYGPDGSMTKIYSDIYKDLNCKLLSVVPVDFGGVAIRKGVGRVPVKFPDDGAGIKVRVPPMEVAIKRFEYLGFNPIPMPFSDLYTALQLGAVDGRTFGPPSEVWQMRDVLETYVFTRDYFEHGAFLVNLDWWNGLSLEEQGVVQKAANDASAWAWDEAEKISGSLIEKIKAYGINVVELDKEQTENMSKIIKDKEWTWLEETVGKDLVSQIRQTTLN